MKTKEAYREGYIAGITAYAYSKDAVMYVGTTGRTLKEAIAKAEETWNYSPPKEKP